MIAKQQERRARLNNIASMNREIKFAVDGLFDGLVAIRRHLHAHPELSGSEAATAAFVANKLDAIGVDLLRTGVGGHGVVAEIRGDQPGAAVALRADMDALPIAEKTGVPYCSTNPGVMHACGHDGHTTMLLGAVSILAAHRPLINGAVRFVFQPSEENVAGAEKMCADGAIDGVQSIYALHGWPALPIGSIGIRSGAMMAAVDDFDIEIVGCGGHTGYPHRAVDPIVIGARIVEAIQSLLSREIDPFEPAVATVTRFQAGTAYNVIPASAHLAGTIRTLTPATRDRLPRRLIETATQIAAAANAVAHVSLVKGSPPVMNDIEATKLVEQVGKDTLGENAVVTLSNPSMGGEDFAVYLERTPGAFFRLGLGDVTGLHTPTFDFPDAAIPFGVEMLVRTAIAALQKH